MSVRIINADALSALRTLPDKSVQACVTSPPYLNLRSYLPADHPDKAKEIGLHDTPAEFIAALIEVFDEVKRVLRDDGVCFVNLGSSYAGSGKGPTGHNGIGDQARRQGFVGDVSGGNAASRIHQPAHVPAYGTDGTGRSGSRGLDSACSDLCDGCLADFLSHRDRSCCTPPLRQRGVQPSSQTTRDSGPGGSEPAIPVASAPDVQASTTLESWRRSRGACSRCDSRAASFARLGLMTDGRGVQEFAHTTASHAAARLSDGGIQGLNGHTQDSAAIGGASADRTRDRGADSLSYLYSSIASHQWRPKDLLPVPELFALAMRYRGWIVRSQIVWAKKSCMPESVRDRPTSAWEPIWMFTKQGAYYWDSEAVRQPLAEGSAGRYAYAFGGSKSEHLYETGAVRTRPVGERETPTGANIRNVWHLGPEPSRDEHYAAYPTEIPRRCILAATRKGDTVLDPFLGSGTTALVADRLERNAIGIELSPKYAAMARRRIEGDAPLFADVEVAS